VTLAPCAPTCSTFTFAKNSAAEQQKGLRAVLLFGAVLLAVLFKFCA
jgi:hypothetical protein